MFRHKRGAEEDEERGPEEITEIPRQEAEVVEERHDPDDDEYASENVHKMTYNL